jgi:S1-C subfamily serine protease
MSLFTATASAQPEQSIVRQYVHVAYTTAVYLRGPYTGQRGVINSGSVVVIAPGYAVSAWHVFATTSEFPANTDVKYIAHISPSKTETVEFTVLAKNVERDLALLKGEFKCPCAPIGIREPELDTQVYAVGFPSPATYDQLQLVSRGTMQGMSSGWYATTTSITSGVSGGGLFQKQDGEYRLVGIVKAIGRANIEGASPALGISQQLGWLTFSIPFTHVRDLFNKTPANSLVR